MGKIWLPDHKFWSPPYLIYNLHINSILNVTLLARKLIIARNSIRKTYKASGKLATVVLSFSVSGDGFVPSYLKCREA